MFALPGLVALILVEYLRPQEYFESLRGLPLLHLAAALAGIGLVVDLRLGLTRLRAAPHLLLASLFFLWCLVTLTVRAPDQLASRATTLLIPFSMYLLVAHGLQTFRALQVVAATILAICLALAALGIHQAMQPLECRAPKVVQGVMTAVSDGRACTRHVDCEGEGAEPGETYECERGGLLGTFSIMGRVRYRGSLADPNELALALSVALPFAFALYDRRRSTARLALAAVAVVMVGLCAYFTQSRGGQLVFLAVLGAYFVNSVGLWRGGVSGLLLSLPILVLGGRSGGEASTMERTECWWVGLHLLGQSQGLGVGAGQFTEHHFLTAHNTFILAAAELGVPGLLLWTSLAWLCLKIPAQVLRSQAAPVARSWALALLASLIGLLVGVFFLSFLYRDVLWLYVGLTGVLYGAVRRHDPGFEVRFGVRDLAAVAAVDAVLLAALTGFTVSKLGW
jgi:O-antigen ligase